MRIRCALRGLIFATPLLAALLCQSASAGAASRARSSASRDGTAAAPSGAPTSGGNPAGVGAKIFLRDGWMLQSSCKISAAGRQISSAGFATNGWHPVTVPSTVVAALVQDQTYPDPYFGDNLRSIPGTSYPIGEMFAVLPMPQDSPFRCSWWYRTQFQLPQEDAGRRVWLNFGGINNRANIWLNGRRIANAQQVAGAYRTYELDVTPFLTAHRENVLAVETIAQTEKDLAMTWVDWNPSPPDKDMGLWREVYLQASGPVTVRYPQVITHFTNASLARADLTVEAELNNATRKKVTGKLAGAIEGTTFEQTVTLGPGESRTVRFSPDQYAQLRVQNPQAWWPRQMGAPALHDLAMRFLIGEKVSDSASVRFGIREVTSEIDPQEHRFFAVNGKKILIRGGGWAPDMLLREQPERLLAQFRYINDLNLNAVRLEGKMESDEFYNLADQNGVLVLAGWSCCDYWEQWQDWRPDDLHVATASLHSQIMRMRSHASMLAWLNGSDNPPPANVESAYIGVLKAADWPNPYISSASQKPAEGTGPSGVKMLGPYDYVPPDYWLADADKYGGAYGFNTEASPGPAVPVLSSLQKMLPASHIAPDDAMWNYHAGSEGFKDLSHFEEAMKAIYGPPTGLADYEAKAQAMAYDAERAMFESYSRNKYNSTGIVQWMLNNAWPSLIWHLYDYYLQPGGGYFGAKKALEPLHVQYSYDDGGVAVVNSAYRDVTGLKLTAKFYDFELRENFSQEVTASVPADAVVKALAIPNNVFRGSSPVYFLSLKLEDGAGKVESENFYWLSAKKSEFDWTKTTYRYTPVTIYQDFTALQQLPSTGALQVTAKARNTEEGQQVLVRIHNPSGALAFQVSLAIRQKAAATQSHSEILPVLWQDNYFELLPGETREVTAQFLSADALGTGAELDVSGWNIPATIIPVEPDAETSGQSRSRP